MRKDILKIANKKLIELSKKYDKFINVLVDDWREYRFVFDTDDVRTCKNDCRNCDLYKILQKEKTINDFDPGLYPASPADKKIFGPQNFLNCKTIDQYYLCYLNFLNKKAKTEKEIVKELGLIKELAIIYSRYDDQKTLERKFKESLLKKFKNQGLL